MGQSLVKNYLHIIFSTKNRYPFIKQAIEKELFNYIGGICKNLDCQPLIVGGYANHIHILCSLSKRIALVNLIEEIKSHSSKWIKTKGDEYSKFFWQDGYAAFSVSPKQTDDVIAYITNQRDHHKTKTYEQEFRVFLKKYKTEYDERYVWE